MRIMRKPEETCQIPRNGKNKMFRINLDKPKIEIRYAKLYESDIEEINPFLNKFSRKEKIFEVRQTGLKLK